MLLPATLFRPSGKPRTLCAAAGSPASAPASPARDIWRVPLYARLREQPYPLFIFGENVISAAMTWFSARLWIDAFREAGLKSGDRIVMALPASPSFVQVLVACLWEGYTLFLAPPQTDENELYPLLETLDARCLVANASGLPFTYIPSYIGGPETRPSTLRSTELPAFPDARLCLRTSGSRSGKNGRWIALSDANLWSVLDSHRTALQLVEGTSRVLSVLPWHHAFGLMMDLLPGLLAGAEIIREGSSGQHSHEILQQARLTTPTHFNAVPLTIKQLIHSDDGAAFLRSVENGIVGGAPVNGELPDFLRTTRLRAGYGQTEASPGIAIGEPGYWPRANYLGRPLGCAVRTDAESVLWFAGANACLGHWLPGEGIKPVSTPLSGWRSTGDIVACHPESGDLFFQGRTDDTFKLSNGRQIEAGVLETAIAQIDSVITDAILFTTDGEQLTLLWTGPIPLDPTDLETSLQKTFQGLMPRLTTIQHIPESRWRRNRKGATDRCLTIAQAISTR